MVGVEQGNMFVSDLRLGDAKLDMLVPTQSATLTSGWLEVGEDDSQRSAFLTRLTLRPEYVIPKSSPAAFDQSFE